MTFNFVPKVNPSREFLEIASDFSNPLDIVREAISNSVDAKATELHISFTILPQYGQRKLRIVIRDNGLGMDYEGLQSFFDLGNSLRRDAKIDDLSLIGEKGHGTKIYFNSERIGVITGKYGKKYSCHMQNPLDSLYESIIPEVEVEESNEDFEGTFIDIVGYNNNERNMFNHERVKDYVYWFTKFASFEGELNSDHQYKDIKLFLQGIDRQEAEILTFGHKFPNISDDLDKLLNEHIADAPDHFVKKLTYSGTLKKFPDIAYNAVFYIVGNKAKRSNKMLKRSGYTAPSGGYTVQERYGIWLTKDYIPIQRKNEWINKKGSEYTKFEAFFNCQELKLTANRGSIDNTSGDILDEIKDTVLRIYTEISESEDWGNLEWLEEQSDAYQTKRKEEKDLEKRLKQLRGVKSVDYKGFVLREPRQEHGVFSIYHAIDILEKGLFPFEIIDYDTHAGIDVLARKRGEGIDLERSHLRFVEFKYRLKSNFNHSFEKLYGIVCWDLQVNHDEVVVDSFDNKRKLRCIPRTNEKTYTQYFLEDERDPHRIEIIVLEEYLQERLGIIFKRIRS